MPTSQHPQALRNKYYIQYQSKRTGEWHTDNQPFMQLGAAILSAKRWLRHTNLVDQVRLLEFKMTNVIDIKPPKLPKE